VNSGESQLIDDALELLSSRLPSGWSVDRAPQEAGNASDAVFAFTTQSGIGTAIVEARTDFGPADVDRLLGGLTRRLRDTPGSRPILLVSDFLSPRTRELLRREGLNYLDLTGNVRLALPLPALFIEVSGADRRTRTARRRSAGLSGAKVGGIVRFLAEVVPPYGVIEIERATGISRGYISRILDRLADEALIRRAPRGPVEAVDWPAILRRRGESVDLFKANTTRTYQSPNGPRALLETLSGSDLGTSVVVTGSFAAVRKAPIAAPSLLVLYLDSDGRIADLDQTASALGLQPADEAPDVALLLPANARLVDAPWIDDGLRFVNLPQLAVDCLGGTGRMPAEGDALIGWMEANTTEWQYPSLAARPNLP
jgi:hypothetical protein